MIVNYTFPLSLTQQDIYFDQLHHEMCPLYNIGGFIKLAEVDVQKLVAAHQQMVHSHDVFGMRIVQSENSVEQYVSSERDDSLPLLDFSNETDPDKHLADWSKVLFETALDIHDQPLYRAYLIKLADDQFNYIGFAHHLMIDGWGFSNWARLLGQYYHDSAFEAAPLDWHQIIEKDQQYLASKRYQKDKAYWSEQLEKLPQRQWSPKYISTFDKKASIPSYRTELTIPTEMHRALLLIAQQCDVPIAQVYLSILVIYYGKIAHQNNIAIGLPAHNRSGHAEKSMVGVFTSISPISTELILGDTCPELFNKLNIAVKRNFKHQRYPLGHMKRDLLAMGQPRDKLYDIAFNYLKLDSDITIADHVAELEYLSHNHEQTPLMMTVWEYGQNLPVKLQLDHSLAYISEEDGELLAARLAFLVEQLVENPDAKIEVLQLIPDNEYQQLVDMAQGPESHYSEQNFLHSSFERQARKTPNVTALIFNDQRMSYQQLNYRANQLAHYLRTQIDIVPDSKVGICMERGPEMVIAMMGILKAGAAYVPIDPETPTSRKQFIVDDANLSVVLTCGDAQFSTFERDVNKLKIDTLSGDNINLTSLGFGSEHLAYVIYTSGSTGQPKGVMIEHKAINNRIEWMNNCFPIVSEETVLQKTPYHFDVSIWEFFWTLSFGGQLVLAKPGGHKDPEYLAQVISQHKITRVHFVPSMLKAYLADPQRTFCASVTHMFCSGEAIEIREVHIMRERAPHIKMFNLYGPTEAAIEVSAFACEALESKHLSVPIGKAIQNTQLYVLNEDLSLCPMGESGELYIGGVNLARGYLNRPDLTEQYFLDNPFVNIAGNSARLYKTGDLARYSSDGEIEFLGRKDFQVKIRGFRIELGEIEYQLEQCGEISSAVVTAKIVAHEEQLVGYIVLAQGIEDEEHALKSVKAQLLSVLPDYMVPTILLPIPEVPLTPSGKADRKALPEPDLASIKNQYHAPESVIEWEVAAVWADMLSLDLNKISRDHTFFELGGHSVTAITLAAMVSSKYAIPVTVRDIFTHNRLCDLAKFVAHLKPCTVLSSIPQSIEKERPALSTSQQRLWFLDQMQQGSVAYNMPIALEVNGEFDLALAESALSAIINRHQILRTVYHSDEEGVWQLPLESWSFEITPTDVRGMAHDEQVQAITTAQLDNVNHTFNLSQDLMIRAECIVIEGEANRPTKAILLLNLHHIASDGWSMSVLFEEFSTAYTQLLNAQAVSLPALDIQYLDFAQWQSEQVQKNTLQSQQAYWQHQLAELPKVHGLPLKGSRPSVKQSEGKQIKWQFNEQRAAQLHELAKRLDVTPFMLFHGALSLIFGQYSAQNDIVIGTPVVEREHPQLSSLMGMFVNSLVLRVNTQHDSLSSFFTHIKSVHEKAHMHSDMPFDHLVDLLEVERAQAYTPLFQIMLSSTSGFSINQNSEGIALPNCQLQPLPPSHIHCKFDLEIELGLDNSGGYFIWNFDTSLFDSRVVEKMCERLELLLARMCDSTENESLVALLAPLKQEQYALQFEKNQTHCKALEVNNVYELIERSVTAFPDSTALVCADKRLTYAQLDRLASYWAKKIVYAMGGDSNRLVGIHYGRSAELVIAVLACLKAGAAYVPIDIALPVARQRYILEDTNLSIVLSQQADFAEQTHFAGKVMSLSVSEHSCNEGLYTLPGATKQDLAYIIYTSGSTGQPKGVCLNHGSVLNYLLHVEREYLQDKIHNAVLSSTLAFDATVTSLFSALMCGGALTVIDEKQELIPALHEAISGSIGSTIFKLTPAHLQALSDYGKPFNTAEESTFVVGGEQLTTSLALSWQKMLPQAKIINEYGPTEATVGCCTYIFPAQSTSSDLQTDSVAIGSPIVNTQLYVLDEHLQWCLPGCIGELYIGGDSLALGYLNRDELTAQRFIENPHCVKSAINCSEMLYKTGDLVRYRLDGELEFVGRSDEQVKLRGYRIELGEIENNLRACEGVHSALVVLNDDERLIGYVKSSEQRAISAQQLNGIMHQLATQLPHYMLLDQVIDIAEWPLTNNGKIDKKALPKPNFVSLGEDYLAPTSDTELSLCSIWSQLLQIPEDTIGLRDDFFKLGGNSLLTTRLVASIRKTYSKEVAIRAAFEKRTLQAMAKHIDELMDIEPEQEIERVELGDTSASLSFAQQRLWFIDRLEGGSSQYNISAALNIEGNFDPEIARQALQRVVERHEVLRTNYLERDGQPTYTVASDVDFTISNSNLAKVEGEAQQLALKAALTQESVTSFDLERDLMLRAHYFVLRTGEKPQGVLAITLHHIASDGWSTEILIKEFVNCYESLIADFDIALEPLAIQYSDYAHWQQTWLHSEEYSSQLQFWQTQLDGAPILHGLPLKHVRPERLTHEGERVNTLLSKSLMSSLNNVAKQYQMTPFMLVQGVLALVLSRHSHDYDIVMGTPVANRRQSQLEELIGFFVNTLVLRTNTAHESVYEFFNHVRDVHLNAQHNQEMPFEKLVESLAIERHDNISPLFQIMVTTDDRFGIAEDFTLAGMEVSYRDDLPAISKFDLEIKFAFNEPVAQVNWLYDRALFSEEYIEVLSEHFKQALYAVCQAEPNGKLDQINILTEKQTDHLCKTLNPITLIQGDNHTILDEFDSQVRQKPHDIAVNIGSQSLSFAQLNEQANAVAHDLIATHGVKPQDKIGICVTRSLEMVVGILGILKAGAAYVPIDPSYPKGRIDHILQDANLHIVITNNLAQEMVDLNNYVCVNLDEKSALNALADIELPKVEGHWLAYIIYTSGSTGKPKGVMVEHQSLHYSTLCRAPVYEGFSAFLLLSSVAFDSSVAGIFACIAQGAKLCLVEEGRQTDVEYIVSQLVEHKVSHFLMVPSFYEVFLSSLTDEQLPTLNGVIVAGESCPSNVVSAHYDKFEGERVTLFNEYGPTEATVWSTVGILKPDQPVHIGRAIINKQLYVMHEHGLAPLGSIGELYIGGLGLARGYLNQPALTAERFVVNPFYDSNCAISSERLYRTGDLVRYLPGGEIEFIGRTDDQVKIRGYRIELGEIEASLAQYERIESSLVDVVGEGNNKQLVAYLRLADNLPEFSAQSIDEIASYMAQRLPIYMCPTEYFSVEQWPVTPNGKIDKKALAELYSPLNDTSYVAPINDIELSLATIWSKLLNIDVEKIGRHSDFFTLGGHSLLSVRLVMEVKTALGSLLSLQDIFKYSKLMDMSQVIVGTVDNQALPDLTATSKEGEQIPLSYSQQRLMFIDQLQGSTPEYNITAALDIKGAFEPQLAEQALTKVIERHAILRTVYIQTSHGAKQVINGMSPFHLQVEDLSMMSDQDKFQALHLLSEEEAKLPFDLSQDVMLRAKFVWLGRQNEERYGRLFITVHHIASDGWSANILLDEFSAYYRHLNGTQSKPPAFAELPVQYADFATWQRENVTPVLLQKELTYWQQQLADLPPVHSLPRNTQRQENSERNAEMLCFSSCQDSANALMKLAQNLRLTPFMLLHGALSLVLSRHSNSQDIVIGTPVANRLQPELAPLIGFFVNTLVLRINTDYNSITEYFEAVRQVHIDAQEHQSLPFEQLVEQLPVERDLHQSPLFQILLTASDGVVNKPVTEHRLDQDVFIEHADAVIPAVKFDLEIDLNLSEHGVSTSWLYDGNLFDADYIRLINSHLENILADLVIAHANQQDEIYRLQMLSVSEYQQLAVQMNTSVTDYNSTRGIHELIAEQVGEHGHKVAVRCGESTLTYRQLDERSNQLCHYIQGLPEFSEGQFIGICVERSVHMVVSILAILKAGCAYVPLDPSYPQDRIDYIILDAGIDIVLMQTHSQDKLACFEGCKVNLDSWANEYTSYQKKSDSYTITSATQWAQRCAYVVYTSGSTGKPKGVMVTHGNLCALLAWAQREYASFQLEKVLAATSLNFDLSAFELFVPLSLGHEAVVVKNALSLIDEVVDVTLINTVPSAISALLEVGAIPASVNTINLAGEPLSGKIVNGLLSQTDAKQVYNLYGPSEDTTYSTFARFDQPIVGNPHIGRVIDNTQAYVLDAQLAMIPKGAIGELCLAGDGLTKGYLNRSDLTAEKFIHHPVLNKLIYRTGDLVRYLECGNFEYLGRLDDQVKIRGFRVELAEVTLQLEALSEISSALVMSKEVSGQRQLVAYLEQSDASRGEYSHDELASLCQSKLAAKLPNYMVPSYVMVLDEWPLLPNGKINKRALPEPKTVQKLRVSSLPSDPVVQSLATIWSALLEVDLNALSLESHFFNLGGHSLLSVRLTTEIQATFGVQVSLKHVFEAATLQQQVDVIQSRQATTNLPPISSITSEQKTGELSYAQKRLWLTEQISNHSSQYNMPMAFKVTGQFSVGVAEQALYRIIQRHAILRTTYHSENHGTQVVEQADGFSLPITDLTNRSSSEQDQEVAALMLSEENTPFDLHTDLMLRGRYINLSTHAKREGILLLTCHHIASDGWSLQILKSEFASEYAAIVAEQPSPVSELPCQYGDFAAWQQRHQGVAFMSPHIDYWRAQLEDAPAVHGIRLDKPRPKTPSYQGRACHAQLPTQTAKSLYALSQKYGVTPFMLMHAALGLVLSKHSFSDDIVVGTPVANRTQPEVGSMIGFFVNNLVLRLSTAHKTLADYLAHVKAVHLNALEHQALPFEYLIEQLNVQREPSIAPLFQIMVANDNDFRELEKPIKLCEMQVSTMSIEQHTTRFDMEIGLSLNAEYAAIRWVYDEALFDLAHVDQMVQHLVTLLVNLAETEKEVLPLADLSCLTDQETELLVHGLNQVERPYSRDLNIEQLFELQVLKRPDDIAVIDRGVQYTYQEINNQANLLAHYLIEHHGVVSNQLIGLCCGRSTEMVVAILAILKAGAGYVPLDPNYPQSRIDYVLEDAQINLILSGSDERVKFSQQYEVLIIDTLISSLDNNSGVASNPVRNHELLSTQRYAYVIYTSGSTGQPKGVITPHTAVVRLVSDVQFMQLDDSTVMLLAANIAFDAATFELWGPLLNGGTCVLYPDDILTPQGINALVAQHKINTLWLTSGFFQAWSGALPEQSSLTQVITGGDVMSQDALEKVHCQLPNIRVLNAYGPTENTTFSSVYETRVNEQNNTVPIGARLVTDQAFILDKNQQLVPYGAVGELCLGGDGLAVGYLGKPALTEERFISPSIFDKHNKAACSRLYRTGDLVRYTSQGIMEFVGRVDEQVKVRGFRIEIGEIANQLSSLDIVRSALVVLKERGVDKELLAYLEPVEEIDLDTSAFIAEVKKVISDKLPSFMLPQGYSVVSSWPLNANGKIDKSALPEIEISEENVVFEAPQGKVETPLALLWAEVLGVDVAKVGRNSNFFNLGGHSLLAVRLSTEIQSKFDIDLSAQMIFMTQTLAELATEIAKLLRHNKNALQVIASDKPFEPAELSYAQQRLWFIDQLQGATPEYHIPIVMDVAGDFNVEIAEAALQLLVERHVVLSSTYQMRDDIAQVVPQIDPQFKLDITDLSAELNNIDSAQAVITQSAMTPFELSTDLMLRGTFIKLSDDSAILSLTMHHIASDGWSVAILVKEFCQLYDALYHKKVPEIGSLTIQYADYARWQKQWLQRGELQRQLDYWRGQLADLPVCHNLQLDYPRSAIKQNKAARLKSRLPVTVANGLKKLATQSEMTPFMLMHAALALVLSRHSGNTDIVIGTPLANRPLSELQEIIGFFVNTLALRVETSHPSVAQYLEHVKLVHRQAQSHQDVPFEQLVDTLSVPRSTSHAPIFQIMLTTGNDFGIDMTQAELPNAQLSARDNEVVASKYDIEINIALTEDGLELDWLYDVGLFNPSTIERLNAHLESTISELSAMYTPSSYTLSDIKMLSDQEVHRLVVELNDNSIPLPQECGIHHLVEQQALCNPLNVAVSCSNKSITYEHLNSRSNLLANYLLETLNVSPGSFIGVCTERNIDMVISVLAVLKAGCAYVPIDANYPISRIDFIIEDTGLEIMICHQKLAATCRTFTGDKVFIDGISAGTLPSEFIHSSAYNPRICDAFSGDRIAYVIYTSGSTGKPKGVLVQHNNVIALIEWAKSAFNASQLSRVLASTSLNFDLSVFEMFVPLSLGYECVVAGSVLTLLEEELDITLINTVPSAIKVLLESKAISSSVNTVNLAGEPLTQQVVNDLLSTTSCQVVNNLYGPSEDTTYSTHACFTRLINRIPEIGKALNNTQVLILSAQQELVPFGCVGELYLGGAGVTGGYLARPKLTAERFISLPDIPGKWYRSGDLVRYRKDGQLEFCGRIDDQVKVRGFRVELGEISYCLEQLTEVKSALVIASGSGAEQELYGYIQPSQQASQPFHLDSIKVKLRAQLPDYMIPTVLNVVDEWPLTPNGKVDKNALQKNYHVETVNGFVKPKTQTEQQLVLIWAALLDTSLEKISCNANFFDIGGNSLLIVRLLTSIKKQFAVELKMQALYGVDNVVELANVIDGIKQQEAAKIKLAQHDESTLEEFDF